MNSINQMRYERKILDIGKPGDGVIPESFANIPEMRCNDQTIEIILKLVACGLEVEKLITQHYKRCKLVPGAWRDAHMIRKKIFQIYSGLARTVPEPKRSSLLEMATFCQYNLKYNAAKACAAADVPSAVVKLADFSSLCDTVWRDECMFCPNPDKCRKGECHIGNTFDSVLTTDRGSKSWADVDIRKPDIMDD